MSPGLRIRERLRLLLGRAVTTVIVGDLVCPNCLVMTPHEAHYVAGLLHHVECRACAQRWEMGHDRLRASYLRALPGRIRSKPATTSLVRASATTNTGTAIICATGA